MIGILQNHNLDKKKMEDILEWHLNAITNIWEGFRSKLKYGKTKEQLIRDLGKTTIEQIVVAVPLDLANMIVALPHEKLKKYIVKRTGKHIFCHLYETYRTKYGAELVKRLEMIVCPYCNRNFINSDGDKTPAQFDHFINKDSYPIFALSLYNLIPCCNTCNHWKGTINFTISPYDKKYTTDTLIQFSYYQKDIDEYVIETKAIDSRININIDTLQLSKRYATHEDLLKELILKRKCYCKCNKEALNNLLENNGLSNDMTIEEFFYGNYLTEDKYYLRPLSKFTHDILLELDQLDPANC